jgi:hypothetical protein
MGGVCSTYEKTRIAHTVLVGKLEKYKSLGRSRRRWVNNTKVALEETGCEGVDWIQLSLGQSPDAALLNTIMNLRDAEKAGNFLTS